MNRGVCQDVIEEVDAIRFNKNAEHSVSGKVVYVGFAAADGFLVSAVLVGGGVRLDPMRVRCPLSADAASTRDGRKRPSGSRIGKRARSVLVVVFARQEEVVRGPRMRSKSPRSLAIAQKSCGLVAESWDRDDGAELRSLASPPGMCALGPLFRVSFGGGSAPAPSLLLWGRDGRCGETCRSALLTEGRHCRREEGFPWQPFVGFAESLATMSAGDA